MNKCFAYKMPEGKRGFGCIALNVKVCPGKACAFYKTEEQVREEREKCRQRILKELSAEQREHIIEKYKIREMLSGRE